MGRVEGKVAIVTGGAGGIGRAICEILAREGATVVAIDLGEQAGREIVDQIERDGGRVAYRQLDVTDETAVESVFGEVADRFGKIDVLVNNAGIQGPSKPAHEATEEEFDAVFSVNVKGTWLCTKHALRHMLRGGSGSIINLSSINGLVGGSGIPLYHATKGAVRLMSKADAITYAKEGIRVNSVHPGSIVTPLSEGVAQSQPRGAEEYLRKLIEAHPLGRRGEPEDIAFGVLYLASDESKFVTGSELVIDGGYTAR